MAWVRVFPNRTFHAIGEIMLDHSELIIEIKRLVNEVHNDLNDKKYDAAKGKSKSLAMAGMMLEKYVDWLVKNK